MMSYYLPFGFFLTTGDVQTHSIRFKLMNNMFQQAKLRKPGRDFRFQTSNFRLQISEHLYLVTLAAIFLKLLKLK